MKIKKIYQGELPENKILNAQSTSQTDTYSCDYINNLSTNGGSSEVETIRVRYASSSNWKITENNIMPFNEVVQQTGTNLSLDSSGRIVIGKGISVVEVVCKAIHLAVTDGLKGGQLYLNNNLEDQITFSANVDDYNTYTMFVTLDVKEGDIIDFRPSAVGDYMGRNRNTILAVKKLQ